MRVGDILVVGIKSGCFTCRRRRGLNPPRPTRKKARSGRHACTLGVQQLEGGGGAQERPKVWLYCSACTTAMPVRRPAPPSKTPAKLAPDSKQLGRGELCPYSEPPPPSRMNRSFHDGCKHPEMLGRNEYMDSAMNRVREGQSLNGKATLTLACHALCIAHHRCSGGHDALLAEVHIRIESNDRLRGCVAGNFWCVVKK